MRAEGMLDDDASRDAFPHTNVITRALGMPQKAEPDMQRITVTPGDRFLLCSDGLSGELDDTLLRDIMCAEEDPNDACKRLIEHALDHGGRDNITALIVDINGVS